MKSWVADAVRLSVLISAAGSSSCSQPTCDGASSRLEVSSGQVAVAPEALVVATDAGLMLDFGPVAVGEKKTASLSLQWTCGALPITAVTLSGSAAFAFDFSTSDPRSNYAPEDSIRFAPLMIGDASGMLVLSVGGRSVAQLMLAGQGLPPDAGPPECRIGDLRFESGETNPENPCQFCYTADNNGDWANEPRGFPCLGGRCLDGVCTPICVGQVDGTPCGGPGEICAAGSCQYGCVIGGVYLAAGTYDPTSPCRSCQPDQATSDWSPSAVRTPCGDGGTCNAYGTCVAPSDHCTIDGVARQRGEANPDDPSVCCSPAVDPTVWSYRLQDGGTYHAATNWASGFAVADFNQDGRPDLAVVTCWGANSTLSILLGQATGGFALHADYPTCAQAWSLSAGDLNGDGFPDLVVGDCAANSYDGNGGISVHMNLGDGTGTLAPAAVQLFSVQAFGESFPLRDFDGDGILDIALTGGGIYFLKGIGDGGFEDPVGQRIGDRASGEFGFSIAAGDFRDAGLDVVTASADEGFLSLFYGNGSGRFVEQPRLNGTGYARSVTVGDFNGDGTLDLVTVGNGGLTIFQGHGDGTFDDAIYYLSAVGGNAWVTLADLDGDGLPEAITADYGYDTFTVFWHTDGGIEPSSFKMPQDTLPECAYAGDLDGDGVLDVVIGGAQGAINLYVNHCP